MSVPPAIEIEALLSEDRWMRRLARRLVPDPQAAEDLAQDAWVAALATSADGRSRGPRALRPWLRGMLRHLGFDGRAAQQARERRERRTARPEALASTDELVSELELRQRVATALLELGEPERRTLTLRFFRDLSLKEIAAAEGVSVAAIHERVQRGLARLRARLDREHGGRRESWATALLTLTGEGGRWTWLAEAMAMGTGMKLAASVLVLGGGWLVAWMVQEDRAIRVEEPTPVVASAGAPAPMPVARPDPEPAPPRTARSALPIESPAVAPALAPKTAILVPGRTIDPHGNGVRGIEVGWAGDSEDGPTALSDGGGHFALAAPTRTSDEARIVARSTAFVTVVPGRRGTGEPLVVVAPRASFAGRVVDPGGLPVEHATVTLRLRDALFRRLGLLWTGPPPGDWTAETDATGHFEPLELAGGDFVYLAVAAEGFESAEVTLPEGGDEALTVILQPLVGERLVRGVVLDPVGAPVAGARVSAGEEIVATDDEGRFELRLGPPAREEASETQLVAVKPGFAPARELVADLGRNLAIVLHLGPQPAAIAGRVVDQDGEPWPHAVVWALDPTAFGRDVMSVAEGSSITWNTTVEELLTGTRGAIGVRADTDGAFRLDGLLPREYRLMALDPPSLSRAGPWTVAAETNEVELVLPRRELTRVAGRIVSLSGDPIAEVTLFAQQAPGSATGPEGQSPYAEPPQRLAHHAETDAEGRFAFEGLALDHTELVLHHPRLFLRSVPLDERADLEHLELVQALQCELQVDLSSDPAFADAVEVLDGDGVKLETIESFGNGWSMGTRASFRDGLTGVLMIRETAETLVFLHAGQEVLRKPIELDPEGRTTIRM